MQDKGNPFRPGDLVGITVKEARIDSVTTEGHDSDETLVARAIVVGDDGKPYYITVPLEWDTVTVERVAPAEWPPRAGDLWRDRHGELWFIHKAAYQGQASRDLMGRTTSGARWTDDVDLLLADNAPLTLVHREDAS